jgi:hypothetical protein
MATINSKQFSTPQILTGSFTGSVIGSVTGSSTGSFSGSFIGNGSGLTNIPGSSVVGISANRLVSGSVTASVDIGVFNTFRLVNANGILFNIGSFGNVGILTTSSFYTLEVSGSGRFTNGVNVTGSVQVSGSFSATSGQFTGSFGISGSTNIKSSGSSIFSVDGATGRLFQVDDGTTGSLFSVNNASGLPIMNATSDYIITMGRFNNPGLTVSGSAVVVATSSAVPSGSGREGEFRFFRTGSSYLLYAYLGGAWRSSSLV